MDNQNVQNFRVRPLDIELVLKEGFNFIMEITKNTSSNSEKKRRIEENSKAENYKRVIAGFLYGIIYTNGNTDNYFDLLYSINRDNYNTFLTMLFELLDHCHMDLSPYNFDQIYRILDKLAHMNNPTLVEIMLLLCRCIFPGCYIFTNPQVLKSFLDFIKSKINWISENAVNNPSLVGQVFIKILRLFSETHCYKNFEESEIQSCFKEILNDESLILSKLYSRNKEDIYRIGRELFRVLGLISQREIDVIGRIIEDINKNGNYYQLLSKSFPVNGYDPYVQVNIPPLMERMLIFIFTKVRKSTGNYAKYVNWIINKFDIKTSIGETLLADIARYIITCFNFYNNTFVVDNSTPRWIILGYFLTSIKNNILSTVIKQAVFYDWLCFNKDVDSLRLIEPGLQIIFFSAKEYPELTMELIEFLDYYCENFDKNSKTLSRRNVSNAFKIAGEKYIINIKDVKDYKDLILKEEKILPEIKKMFQDLIKSDISQNANNNNRNFPILRINEHTQIPHNIIQMETNMNHYTHPLQLENLTSGSQQDNVLNNDIMEITQNKNDEGENQIDNEICIAQFLSNFISPIFLKNFINCQSKENFIEVLNDLYKNYQIKIENSEDSKKNNFDQQYIDFTKNFLRFYLEIFKKEAFLTKFPNDIQFALNAIQTNISITLFEFSFSKFYSFEKTPLSDIIKRLFEVQPFTLVYFLLYIVFLHQAGGDKGKLCTTFILTIFDFNQRLLRETLHHFINLCVDNFNIKCLNYFFQNGIAVFHDFFFDDEQLVFDIIIYANIKSINSICLYLMCENIMLIDKSLFKIIRLSLDLNSSEQNKLWNILKGQGRIQSLSLKEYIDAFVEFSSGFVEREFNDKTEFFYHFLIGLQNLFKSELCFAIEKKVSSFLGLFEFNWVFSEYVYGIFSVIAEFSGKNTPTFFNAIVDEFIQKHNKELDIGMMRNFIKILHFIYSKENDKEKEKNKVEFRLFDNDNFSLRKFSIKLEKIIIHFGL